MMLLLSWCGSCCGGGSVGAAGGCVSSSWEGGLHLIAVDHMGQVASAAMMEAAEEAKQRLCQCPGLGTIE